MHNNLVLSCYLCCFTFIMLFLCIFVQAIGQCDVNVMLTGVQWLHANHCATAHIQIDMCSLYLRYVQTHTRWRRAA